MLPLFRGFSVAFEISDHQLPPYRPEPSHFAASSKRNSLWAAAGRRRKPAKVLLLGSTGQMGSELSRSLQPIGQVIPTLEPSLARGSKVVVLDLAGPDSIRRAVRETEPNLIVNAAAYTAVDEAESDPDTAMAINGMAPGILSEEAKRADAALVHYSTDYVFDGSGQ